MVYYTTMKTKFNILKAYHGTHQMAAEAIGVSYSAYNKWRSNNEKMPAWAVRLIELEAERVFYLLNQDIEI